MSGLPHLGVRLPNSGPFATSENLLETADRAEQLGFDRVWVHDHISWPQEKLTHFATGSLEACRGQDSNFFESVTTCGVLLGRFERIAVGIAGLVAPLRDPRVLAKQLATLDRLGRSRLVAALGIGAIKGDFEVMGVPFNERGHRTTEFVSALRVILAAEQPASFDGDTIAFDQGTFLPTPSNLPLWLTGSSEPGLARAARLGDGWLTVYKSTSAFQELAIRLRQLCEDANRDPSGIAMAYETYVCVADTHEAAREISRRSLEAKFGTLDNGLDVCMVGTAEAILENIEAYAKAGAQHVELKFIAHSPSQLHEMMGALAQSAGLA